VALSDATSVPYSSILPSSETLTRISWSVENENHESVEAFENVICFNCCEDAQKLKNSKNAMAEINLGIQIN
jgi:hypothetical protein